MRVLEWYLGGSTDACLPELRCVDWELGYSKKKNGTRIQSFMVRLGDVMIHLMKCFVGERSQ